ncbi:hypothetical protein TWF694_000471 [Orbilia ellipsospora]|uniref:PHD-type domain-containing protein n=1 Tax=Orbilia ellipsospora TaxID=2528407 RepID=A0AAV9XNP9_9PEZI
MPPKKSGDSSTGGTGSNAGIKRKNQETKTKAEGRSQTPNDAAPSAAGGPFTPTNGAAPSFEGGVIAFTPMNAPKSAPPAIPARNGSRARRAKSKTQEEVSDDEADSLYEDTADEKKLSKGAGKPPKRRTLNAAMEASSNGESSKGGEPATAAQGSKIPRRRKSTKFKEADSEEAQGNDAEMPDLAKDQSGTDAKKKGRQSVGKEVKKEKTGAGPGKMFSKQSTLERHFRPLSQETDAASKETAKERPKTDAASEEKTDAPSGRSGIILKFKSLGASASSQAVAPSNFYGTAAAEKGDLPAPTGKTGRGKAASNGVHKEKLVLQTNPPSSDTLSESLPSPPVTAETGDSTAIMTPLDSNSGYGGRGRRTTRNAQPVYSGFPTPTTASSVPPQPTTATSRPASPSSNPPATKSAKKTTRSVSPRRGGKKPATATQPSTSTTPIDLNMGEITLTKTTANDRRNRAPKKPRCLDDNGRFIDVEPPKQAVSYGNPKVGPAPVEYGLLPLGTLPPKERIDEVFNRPVPKEPEPRCDMTSAYQFYNLWGTVGNKDVTTMKANQGRAKRMFQKNGKLSADNEWIYPDTEGAKVVTVTDVEEAVATITGGGPKGKNKHKRPRLSTGLGLETSTSPSPSFIPDPQLRSTEELVSPVSENVPETPKEFVDMDIDEPEVQQTRQTSEAPVAVESKLNIVAPDVSELSGPIQESISKPDVLAVIKRAKAMAEEAGNMEVLALLNEVEMSGNNSTALDSINQILRGDMSRRLSPATVPGTKRTALQRDEDEGLMPSDPTEHLGKKRRVITPYIPPPRFKRPDITDEEINRNVEKMLEEARERIKMLNNRYVPKEYTCLRGEPDKTSEALHPQPEDRCFTQDEQDFKAEWKSTAATIQGWQDFHEVQKERARQIANGEGSRRRNGTEKPNEFGTSEDEEMRDVNNGNDFFMDDEESPCTVCGGTGAPLVICDGEGCHEEQHYGCAVPPLTADEVEALPDWYCRRCATKKKNVRKHTNPEYKGTFGPLFEVADQMNPRSFVLPKDIRETFTGVKMGKLGTYKEIIDHFNISKTKDKELRAYDHLRRIGELPFDEQLLGSDGQIARCYQCRESRLRTDRGLLIGCDYCTQYWHQDCLPTPLVEPPAIKQRQKSPPEKGDDIVLMKWKCPLHVPQEAYPIRQPRGKIEGPDFEWPPKHRVSRAVTPIVPEAPSENFVPTKLSGRNLMLPEKGFKLNMFSNVKKAQEVKELNEQMFTGLELQGIEALRNLKYQLLAAPIPAVREFRFPPPPVAPAQPVISDPSASSLALAEFILRNMPELYRAGGVEESILSGAIGTDPVDQIRIVTAIQKSMEAKLSNLLR